MAALTPIGVGGIVRRNRTKEGRHGTFRYAPGAQPQNSGAATRSPPHRTSGARIRHTPFGLHLTLTLGAGSSGGSSDVLPRCGRLGLGLPGPLTGSPTRRSGVLAKSAAGRSVIDRLLRRSPAIRALRVRRTIGLSTLRKGVRVSILGARDRPPASERGSLLSAARGEARRAGTARWCCHPGL